VAESPRNIHFYNIFSLVTADARLTMLFRRLTEGQELGEEEHKELRLTGICRGANPFRNEIYARVFGPGGPLDLKVGHKQIELTASSSTRRCGGATGCSASRRADGGAGGRGGDPPAAPEFREGTALQVGDVLGRGRYRSRSDRSGRVRGGVAGVRHPRPSATVAIKVLHGQFAEDKQRRDRFFRGAWKMSELQHAGDRARCSSRTATRTASTTS
jgi:hypothetical protein